MPGGGSRIFSAALSPPRTSNGSAPKIPCLSPTSNAAPRGSSAWKSPGSTIPSRSRSVPSAPKRSNMVWRCAPPAAPSSTPKKPPSTVCFPQDEENASETKRHPLNQEPKQGSSSQLKLGQPNEKGREFLPPHKR